MSEAAVFEVNKNSVFFTKKGKAFLNLDEEMEQFMAARQASEDEDVEQYMAYLKEIQPEMTEEDREWHIFVVKNGAPCPA